MGVLDAGLEVGGREKVRRYPARRARMAEHSPSGIRGWRSRLAGSLGGGAVDTGSLRVRAKPLASRLEGTAKTTRPQIRPQANSAHPDRCAEIFDFHWDFEWSGREDLNLRPPWSRTRFQTVLKSAEFYCFQVIDIEPVAGRSWKAVVFY